MERRSNHETRHANMVEHFDDAMQHRKQEMDRSLDLLMVQREVMQQVARIYGYSTDRLQRVLSEHSKEYIRASLKPVAA